MTITGQLGQGTGIAAQVLDFTGDGHGRHIPGSPMVYRHGYKPVDGTEIGKDGIRRPGSGKAKASPAPAGGTLTEVPAAPLLGDSPAVHVLGGLLSHDGSETADKHLADLDLVPAGFLQALKASHVKVVLTSKSVGGADPSLHGQQPRGYPAGKTWDDVPGAYDPNRGTAIPGNTGTHGSSSLALHEGSHAIDHALGAPSQEAAFGRVYDAFAASAGARLSPYFRQAADRRGSTEEFFGETLAAWIKTHGMSPKLRQAAMVLAVTGAPAYGGAAETLDTYYSRLLEGAEALGER